MIAELPPSANTRSSADTMRAIVLNLCDEETEYSENKGPLSLTPLTGVMYGLLLV